MKKSSLVLALAVFAVASSLWAQSSRATLGGRVTDAQGSAVPNAEVSVVSEDTAVKQITRTNEQGNWVVQFLIPARYNFTISAAGFKSLERKGIVLQTSDNKQIDSQLEIGSTTTELTVTAEVPLIDTTAATSGTVISQDQILEMPSQFARAHPPGDAVSRRAAAGSEQQHRAPVVARCGLADHGGWRPQQYALQQVRAERHAEPQDRRTGRLHARARCHPGIPRGDERLRFLHRTPGRRHHPDGDQERHRQTARQPLRVQPEQRFERQHIPEQPGRRRRRRRFTSTSTAAPSAVRCGFRRSTTASRRRSSSSPTTAPATRIRASARAPSSPTSNARAISRQSFTSTVTGGIRTRVPLQIYDPTTVVSRRRPHALPGQRDSHQPPEQGGAEHPHLRAPAE